MKDWLYPITAAMFAQMSMANMSFLVLPVVAPTVADELKIDPSLIGIYTACIFGAAMVAVNAAGPLIDRFGALRIGQVSLILMGVGVTLTALGWLAAFIASAVILGIGISMSTPTSSHVVGQHCPTRQAPLFISIKQTGVPIGGLLAGLFLPALVVYVGWRGTILAAGVMSIAVAAFIQPLRGIVDSDRRIRERFLLADVSASVKLIMHERSLRGLAIAGMTFVGLQNAYGSYIVTYLVQDLDYSLALAGSVFALAQGGALVARILWGIVASYAPARYVLAILAFSMTIAAVLTGTYTQAWSISAIMGIAILFGATAFSWQGVLFAEVARLAPDRRIGTATGGVMFFIYIGMTSYPLIFASILSIYKDYSLGFLLLGIPSAVIFIMILTCLPLKKYWK